MIAALWLCLVTLTRDARTPLPGPVAPIARRHAPGLRVGLVMAALLAGAACGCNATTLTALRTSADVTATVANAGGRVLLQRYCADQLAARHSPGALTTDADAAAGVACVPTGAPRAPTADEAQALAGVRARYHDAFAAAEVVRQAHGVVTGLLADGALETLPAALTRLALQYGRLVALAQALGLDLPTTAGRVTP